MSKLKKQWLVVLLGVLSALLLAISASLLRFAIATTAFTVNNNIIKADAAIVLGAAVWGDEPSPVFRERINHAINLYKSGDVRTIIFTGGVGESNEPAEAIIGKRYAIAKGVKAADILTETESRTTHQNLKNARMVAFKYHLTKFLIVQQWQ